MNGISTPTSRPHFPHNPIRAHTISSMTVRIAIPEVGVPDLTNPSTLVLHVSLFETWDWMRMAATTFSYDSQNHLVAMNGGAVQMLYDSDGRQANLQ